MGRGPMFFVDGESCLKDKTMGRCPILVQV
ncbi:MAG: hypothetical protein ACI9NQ_000173 [Paracoccaceae bacterium]|jgi:hypothetical protein